MEETMKSNLKKSMLRDVKERRKVVLSRLKKQLVDDTKPNKNGLLDFVKDVHPDVVKNPTITNIKKHYPTIPLSQKDIERIKKEIAILETRI